MRGLPRSLKGRLIASAVAFIVLAVLATGLAVVVSLHRFVRGQIDGRLDGEVMALASAFRPGPDGRLAPDRIVDPPPFDDPRSGWLWVARAGDATWVSAGLRGADPGAMDLDLAPAPHGPHAHPATLEGRGPHGQPIRARALSVTVAGQPLAVLAAAPAEAEAAPLRDALVPVVASLALLGCGLVGATLVQVRLGLRPLDRLRTDLAAVRAGRLDRLPADQPAEVRPLATEVNSLLDQHTANLERARRHVANLAHALKTPLAALGLALEAPARDPDRSLRGLTVAMDRRIRHHLARARAAALGTAARVRLPLADRIDDHVAAFAKIYADRALACGTAVPGDLTVACDSQDLDEMVGNLLDNAFKWARTAIRVEASREGRRVRLRIGDDGPGVAPDALAAVLMPGRRLDEDTPGDGFGLAIAGELAELYGGSLHLGRAEAGGLLAELDLPGAGTETLS